MIVRLDIQNNVIVCEADLLPLMLFTLFKKRYKGIKAKQSLALTASSV